jgi:hypothetical protein
MAVSTLKRKAAKNRIKSVLRNQKLKGTTLGSYANPNRVARVSLSEAENSADQADSPEQG